MKEEEKLNRALFGNCYIENDYVSSVTMGHHIDLIALQGHSNVFFP